MASIKLPAQLLSLGSKVSMWLTPPHMNRKMTDLARGVKCGSSEALGMSAGFGPEAAQRDAQKPAAGLMQKTAAGRCGRIR